MSTSTSSSTLSEASIVRAVEHQTMAQVEGEKVILDLKEGLYYGLDPVGALIWDLIQDPASVGEVATRISEKYDVSYDRSRRDVMSLLADLRENDLIVVEDV